METKDWGTTERMVYSSHFQRHRLTLLAGGFCSVHFHATRANRFILERGVVHVVTFYAWRTQRFELVARERTELEVPSLVPHMFQAMTDASMVEEYWPDRGEVVGSDDITRLSRGGMLNASLLAKLDQYPDALSLELQKMHQLLLRENGRLPGG